MPRSTRIGQALLVLLGAVCVLVSGSVYAPMEDPFEPDAQGMVASFGVGFGVLIILLAVAGLNARQRWAWLALWVLPVFFLTHVLLFGAPIDVVLGVVAVVGLLLTRPSDRVYASAGTLARP